MWTLAFRDPDIEAASSNLAVLLTMQGIALLRAVLWPSDFHCFVIRRVMRCVLMPVIRVYRQYCEFQVFSF
jgi:hypothetical protein